MVKNLQCLKTLQICYLRHAEHHAKNRTSLRGLDYDTLFLNDPLYLHTDFRINGSHEPTLGYYFSEIGLYYPTAHAHAHDVFISALISGQKRDPLT